MKEKSEVLFTETSTEKHGMAGVKLGVAYRNSLIMLKIFPIYAMLHCSKNLPQIILTSWYFLHVLQLLALL